MERLIRVLSRRPTAAALLAAACFCTTAVYHDVVQNAVYRFAEWIGRGADEPLLRWNVLITAIGAPLMLGCAAILWRTVRRHPRRRLLAIHWLFVLLLIVASYNTLFCMNSELVHFPQFAILAVLLCPITGRCGETVFWAGLLGAIDEAYQYWWLSRHRPIYYDFNDVVLNFLGALLGVLLVLTFAPAAADAHHRRSAAPSAPAVACAALLAAAAIFAAATGLLRELPPAAAERPALVLRRGGPPPAALTRTTWGKTFRELSPLEGAAGSVLILILAAALDFRRDLGAPVTETPHKTTTG